MDYAIAYTPQAVKDLAALPEKIREQIKKKIAGLRAWGGDIKKLEGNSNIYRLRSGDYRILFTLENGTVTILILRILNRKEAYD